MLGEMSRSWVWLFFRTFPSMWVLGLVKDICCFTVCVMCYNVAGISVLTLIITSERQTFPNKASLSSVIQSMVSMGLRQEAR